MTALLIIIAAIVLLVIGYVFYGNWLSKQWGVDPKRKTPAETQADGVDYVSAKPIVLMGHHFSSIAGAGPINGPIQASVFGWVPVFFWCIIGGIFFGGVHDYGALFASVRNEGKSLAEIIKVSMGERARKLFILFALLVLLLVVASFVNVVAGTFYTNDLELHLKSGIVKNPSNNQTTSMISLLFIVIAIGYGILTNKCGLSIKVSTIIGIVCIALITVLGLNFGIALSRNVWIVLICAYIAIASLVPVWILLQPRDYLSSFLLYGMMGLALIGIISSAFTGKVSFDIPAFTGWSNSSGTLFPTLFITVACGACSGFHSLVSTGTSSKQLDNETHAKPIAYGSMLIESALGIVSLIAVGVVYNQYRAGAYGSPSVAFAAGIATMFGLPGSTVYNTISALLTLAVSVFALTSLDTATRLSRFMMTEFFLRDGEASWKDVKGVRKFFAHPLVGTLIMVVFGGILGGLSLTQIWGLFGAANQLLAGIALMAVAAWLGNVGKNNKMFIIPMIFMLCATITSLVITVFKKFSLIGGGNAHWGDWFQLVLAIAMVALAIVLVIEGVQTFKKQRGKKATAKA